jgi:CelD/BcsL family acetyltransferase involved in cellulose biosynthesis
VLEVAALHAGETPIAIALCMRDRRRVYYWIPAFHPDHARASPGTHLLELLIEDSHRAVLLVFDFLAGLEPYKLGYSTDIRLIGPFGRSLASLPLVVRSRRWLARHAHRLAAPRTGRAK